MAWPKPLYSKSAVSRAGDLLIEPRFYPEFDVLSASGQNLADYHQAIDVLTNWRACHGYPVNTFQATLRLYLRTIDSKAIVAQRLKRTPSIVGKLARSGNMNLSRMQDIGGLRAVVHTIAQLRQLEIRYKSPSPSFKHELKKVDDYVTNPKPTGYRSIHYIYKYRNPRAPEYDGLMIELQMRTMLQHAWATAVETMSTFTGQALKASQGERKWLRFFEIASAAFAHIEGTPTVPGFETQSKDEVFHLLHTTESQLNIVQNLKGFSSVMDELSGSKSHSYHLIILDSSAKSVSVRSYSRNEIEKANSDYTEAEKDVQGGARKEVVLVSAGPIASLKRAYPNYFLDTDTFIRHVEKVIKPFRVDKKKFSQI